MPFTIAADRVEFFPNATPPTFNVYGGEGSYIILEDSEEWDITVVTPTQLSQRKVIPAEDNVINYSQVERLEITGTGVATNGGQVFWTTGDTVDKITVEGTRGEVPIAVSTGGGDDEIYLNGLVGNGSAVNAGAGNDLVRGSSRGDTLEGGDGNDVLAGGGGRDMLSGGAGSDIFKYTSVQDSGPAGIDSIVDFVRGVDKIDLSAIGAFHWIVGAFSGTPGEVRGTMLGIQADLNGDAFPDMIIWVNTGNGGGLTMTASDFIF